MNEESQNNENEHNNNLPVDGATAESAVAVESAETTATPVAVPSLTNRKRNLIIGAAGLVVLLLVVLWYGMERTGKVNTSVFSFIEQARLQNEVIATVGNAEISAYDLSISREQITAAAAARGVDVADPDTQESIREQAVEMLINTELLRQEAARRGIDVTDDQVAARYEQLVVEVGGEEILMERMETFGVTNTVLQRDIRNELVIQALLDQVFADATIEVTDEEVQEVYDGAGGAAAGLPEIEAVEGQIKEQITATKEQEVVNDFVESLRAGAEIEINIEL